MICICILQSRILYYSSVGNSMFIKHVRNGQWQTVDESPKGVCFFERKNVGAFIKLRGREFKQIGLCKRSWQCVLNSLLRIITRNLGTVSKSLQLKYMCLYRCKPPKIVTIAEFRKTENEPQSIHRQLYFSRKKTHIPLTN